MLVWEGDQKHLPPFIIQTSSRVRNERGEKREWDVIGRQAWSAVDDRKLTAGRPVVLSTIEWCSRPHAGSAVDRVMLTAARRECCTQGDAHGRRLGVLSTILPPRPGRRTHCAGTGGVATLPRAVPRNVLRPPALRRAPRSGLLASPQHPVQNIVVSFRRPKHLFHRSPKH